VRRGYYTALTRLDNSLWAPMMGEVCDRQSACAQAARQITELIARRKDTPDQNCRIKEEVWVILDHERFLTEYACPALALLTLQEAHRQMTQAKAQTNDLRFLEQIQVEVRQMHQGSSQPPKLKARLCKHVGNGMGYLSEMRKLTPSPASRPRPLQVPWDGFS